MGISSAEIPSFSTSKAREAQRRLCKKIVQQDQPPHKIRLVAGVDTAYFDDLAIGAVAVLDYDSWKLLEFQTAAVRIRTPYVPTLLAFREIPPSLACIKRLKLQPDVFLADGHGMAHPYGCGFASHLGLAIGKPTIGVAKSRLIGDTKVLHEKVFLVYNGEIVGSVLTPRSGSNPVYVSVGHLVSLGTAVKTVEHCTRRGNRIPEPLLVAHRIASKIKIEMENTE